MKKIAQLLDKIIFFPLTQVIFRLILGATFIIASIDKLIHPKFFAEVIYSYQLLPIWLVNFTASIMPMLELVIGITLILGLFTRESSFILSGLCLVFIVAISINLIRGLEISCGCFEVISDSTIGIDLLVRDVLLMLAGILIIIVREPKWGIDQLIRKLRTNS